MSRFKAEYQDFKRSDNVSLVKINLFNDEGKPIKPNPDHKWEAKMVKDDKNAGQHYSVILNDNDIFVPAKQFDDNKIPSGDYGLELWETYEDNTVIYPSAGFIPVRIHRNADDSLATIDPTTDINEILSNIAKAGKSVKVVATKTTEPGSPAKVEQTIDQNGNQLTFYIPAGKKGNQGNPGKSAFDLWKEQGNKGTIEDFLKSLVGGKGDPGDAGKDAYQTWLDLGNSGSETDFINYLKGPQGDTGPVPDIQPGSFTLLEPGESPYFHLTKIDDTHFKYDIGFPKPQDGKNANPPEIGDNDNWFQDGVDTGHSSKGKQGDQGLPAKITGIEVTTLPAGTQATADVVSQENNSYVIQLAVPKGDTGGQVIKPSLKIGEITPLTYDQTPTVSLELVGENSYLLNAGIPVGKPGTDGKSAYQIWLDAGNSGTEQDFLKSFIPDTTAIQQVADSANSAAQSALKKAESATTTANSANSNAAAANEAASSATSMAQAASNTASNANSTAAQAIDTATAAQSAADQALSKEPDLTPYLTSDNAAKAYATKDSVPVVVLDTSNRTLSINDATIDIPAQVDLSDYATKNELPNVKLDLSTKTITINGQSINIPNGIDLSGFYTKQEIDDKLANAVSGGRVDLTGYLKVNDADAKYATKAELPDLSSYALKSDVPSIAGLAKESDIPQISLDVATRTLTLGTTSIKIPDTVDLSGYATKSEIPQVTMNLSSRTITISGQSITVPQSVDLADYYTKGEVDTKLANAQTGGQVDLSNYLTVRDADKKYAVEESVKSLFAKRGIDVTEHGLVGDGKTDNTEAFKKLAVWADQQPMKMTLWFPAGTYLWSSTVQFNNMVELAGTESSWLKYMGTGTGLLLGKDGITEAEHINYRSFTVRNLCFTGGEDSDYLIEFNNFVTQSRVTGCQFHNAGGRNHGTEKQFCIYFNDDAWDGRVEHNQFDVTKDGGQRQFVGMSEYGNSRVMVDHNLVTSLSGFGTAIYLNGLNNQVMANKIEGFQTPVRLGGAADDAIVAFNYFEKNGASKPSACVEIGDPDATNAHSPKHIYIAYNYAGLHNKSDKMYSYLVGPSSPHALLRNVLIEGNFINGADWTANPAVMGYVVNENNVTGQSDNHANNNYLSIGIKDILDTRTNDGSTNVREPWIVMDSPSKEVNIDLSDYAKLSQLANYVKRAELSDYAKKSDIPSIDGFATQSQLSNYVQQAVLNDYAKKTDIPDLSGYLTSSAAAMTYATNASVDSKISSAQPDLTDINNGIAVNKADIDKVASDLNAVSASASATQAYVSSQSNTLSAVADMAKQGSNTATAALQKAIDAMSTAESAVSAQSSATIDYEMIVKRVDDDIAGKILTMKFGGGK